MPRQILLPYNYSIRFNGVDSSLTKTSPTGINNGTNGSVSLAGWIYLTSNVLGTVAELHVNGGTSPSFGMGQQGGQYYVFSDRVNASNNRTISTAAFSQYIGVQRWAYVTYVLTSTTFGFYAGKTAVLSPAALGTAINAGTISSLFFGKGQTNAQIDIQPLGAYLKDWRIFNGALTQTEIDALNDSQTIPSSSASHFGMDEGSGTSIVDDVGSNSLTATNITWSANLPCKARAAAGTRDAAGVRAAAGTRTAIA